MRQHIYGLWAAALVIQGTLHTVFEQLPATATVNQPITPAVTVRVEIGDGTPIGDGIPVTLTLAAGPAAILSGNIALTAAGTAIFPDLAIDTTGSYRLRAEAPGVDNPAISDPIEIQPGAPDALAFASLPGAGVIGLVLNPAVAVTVADAHGNSVLDGTEVILGIATGPAGAGLSGGMATTVGGSAVFPAVILDEPGSYTLRAGAGTAETISTAFEIMGDRLFKDRFEVMD